jgi:hypothetical protein
MNSILRHLRSPVRLAALLLLLTASIAFFCLGAGVWASARCAAKRIDEGFVTLAVPKQIELNSTEFEGGVSYTDENGIPPVLISALEEMAGNGPVKGVYRQSYINAYCPSLTALLPGQEGPSVPDSAHNGGVFVIEIGSVDLAEQQAKFGGARIDVSSKVLETLAVHPDIAPSDKARVSFDCSYQGGDERLEALGIEKGKRFIIKADAISDIDLFLKGQISSILNIDISEVDLSKISFDLPEGVVESMISAHTPSEQLPVAIYPDGNGGGVYLTQSDIDSIGLFEMAVTDYYGMYCNLLTPQVKQDENGNWIVDTEAGMKIGRSPLADRVLPAFAEEIEGDTAEFLAAHPDWADAVREIEVRNGSVGLIGTDMLEGMYGFQSGEASISEGRSFEPNEYTGGACVCVISDALARKNGLAVGDTLELSPYWGTNKDIDRVELSLTGLKTQPYSGAVGFEAEPKAFTIVGLYRLEDMWKEGEYAFGANTVFIPNSAMFAEPFTCSDGLFLSVVLENGAEDEFRSALSERGFPENSFVCFDGGYSGIAKSVSGMALGARRLFAISTAVLFAALAVYIALFVSRRAKELGLMRSLGASDSGSLGRAFIFCLLPAAASSVLGAASGAALVSEAEKRLSAGFGALPEAVSGSSPAFCAAAGAAALALFAAAVGITLFLMGRASPAKLIKRG